jgi:lysyl-tRNA synthetase class 1
MRWLYEGVDFEPGGKDHASPNGRYQTSKVISEKIFNYPAPLFQGYEFIGIKGSTGKMSGSSGLNLTPETLLKIYQPEVILWLYSKSEPLKAFDFCFNDGILRQYHEFDVQYTAYKEGKADEVASSTMKNCLVDDGTISTVPMGLLVQLGSVVNFNQDLIEVLFEKIGMNYSSEDIGTRLHLAQYWVEQCAPEMKNTLRQVRNWEVFETLPDDEKEEISRLFAYLNDGECSLDDLNSELYNITKHNLSETASKAEVRKRQSKFFSNVYQLLIDKEAGPRLYLFLFAIDRGEYLHLLDFSMPRTIQEMS